jgi:hypothetical protein
MKPICILALLTGTVLVAQTSFNGRWDLTITTPKQTYPSWMEVTDKAGVPEIRVVGRVASVHPVQDVKIERSRLTFNSNESWDSKNIPVSWEMTLVKGKLTGKQKRSDGVEGKLTGVPAPKLDRKPPAAWTKPEPLFNGKDLTGWENDEPGASNWQVKNAELVNTSHGGNIRSLRKFDDFKLHIEFNCPDLGNSGVYLRGRYEVQVEYEKSGTNDPLHSMGSIYGFFAPIVPIPHRSGMWENYDITLVGRTVTVERDNVTIIPGVEIPGITGGAINSNEGEPGPIYMQGDHTGGMRYRNITISVPQR